MTDNEIRTLRIKLQALIDQYSAQLADLTSVMENLNSQVQPMLAAQEASPVTTPGPS